ncbi:MAG: DUF2306 domain-containing protein [Roseomonas sp.]|nr:DUF2306 domain-containing protein [Roseomonas sp.]MCA3327954.1 DUF2306 domain-containing protein [Roseomonas sp.]MCA3332427.1 DUF2306 domain-containing protein [Roseomonas sp.]MCA3336102.1 DUF2306 domain-containing protein [Roseomonas sp.]MCA3345471.1 DUF2306 domain-containing protein [Roseomonas sp.]
MNLAPLLAAPWLVQAHVAAALAAILLGLVQFIRPKGTGAHRLLGWCWVLLMAVVALSSIGITGVAGPGHFSWIHGLSAFTLGGLTAAVFLARRRNIHAHRNFMMGLYLGALLVTGAFTLLPGRIMGRVVFGW